MEKYLKNLPIRVYIYLDRYEVKVPEHNRPLEIEKWIRNNTDSIGFAFIKEDLQTAIKLNNEFLINSSEMKHISWESEEIHCADVKTLLSSLDHILILARKEHLYFHKSTDYFTSPNKYFFK